MWVFDRQSLNFLIVNDAAVELYGYSRADFAGMSILDIRPAEDAGRVLDSLNDKSRSPRNSGEWRHVAKDGRILDVEVTAQDLELGGRRVTLGIVKDITAQKLAQAELRESERLSRANEAQLRQAQKMEAVGQLTGGIAHDFNNLLTIILANGEVLLEHYGPDAVGGAVADIISAAERGAQLTRQLLAFSRRQALNPRLVQVAHLVDGMMRLLSRILGENIVISLEAAADLWPVIIDESQLETSLANLALNARDAMLGGGRLLVEIANAPLDETYVELNPEAAAGDYVMLAVSDTGQGMTPDVLARVFEPFFTTKGVGKGSGLGMSMVFGFVKQSGGHIKIYSEAGHGTTVRLYLPRAPSAAPAAQSAEQPEPAELAKPGEVVLLVEDDDSVRRMAASTLTRLGYQILDAHDGPSALKQIDSGARIDLLFTDLIMPGGMNGIEVAMQARDKRPALKILFTSGYTEPSWADRMRSLAGAAIISKPYRGVALARRIRELLDRG